MADSPGGAFLGENMKILVISGFLGAGKTTFIRQLCQKSGRDIAVMENEYGEVGVDKTLLEQDGSVNIWEMTEGCICCSVKSDFAASVLTIANSLDPEYLIVEPTGVGKLSRVLENIRMIMYERISLLEPVTIIDPRSFRHYLEKYGEIYADQIHSAKRILLSKGDIGVPADIGAVLDELHSMNPEAEIEAEHYSRKPDSWWRGLLQPVPGAVEREAGEGEIRLYRKEEKVELENIGFTDAFLSGPERLPLFLEELVRGAYGDIVRAKGFIRCGAWPLRFDVVDRRYSITGGEAVTELRCVFIGNGIRRNALRKLLLPGFRPEGKKRSRIRIGLHRI